jgi:photosystem II stability/assembly factor-like uncharacterized protein
MRAFRAPAAAGLAAALLSAAALTGCGATHPAAHPEPAKAAKTEKAWTETASTVPTSHAAAPGAGRANDRLTAIAFTGMTQGYGMFTGQRPRQCPILAGPARDGGARFAPLVTVTTYPCGGYPPATAMAADGHGDVFLYGRALFVSHDGGRTWAARREHGSVLAVAAIGRSVWLVRADCARSVRAANHGCVLRLVESADGGRTWAPAPAQPPGATVRAVGGTVAQEGALGQTWLVRTGPSSAYLLSNPARNGTAPLWFTGNGGAAWSQGQIPCGSGALGAALSAAPDGTLLAVCAAQPTAGYQPKSVARSTDGGQSWTVRAACPPPGTHCGGSLDFGYLGQIAAVSRGTAFLAGDRSSLLVTTDGAHWRPVRPLIGDTGGGTSQVTFFSRRDGIVLGDGPGELPTIWTTTDGGRRWSSVTPRSG